MGVGFLASLGQRPIAGASVGFALGALFFDALPASGWPFPVLGALLLAVVAFGLSRSAPGMATLLILLAFPCIGLGAARLRSATRNAPQEEFVGHLSGTVVDWPRQLPGRDQSVLLHVREVDAAPADFRMRLSTANVPLFPGDALEAQVRLRPASRDANPGANAERRWACEGQVATGQVVDEQLAVLGTPPPLSRSVAAFRDRFARVAEAAVADPSARALLQALAVGERTNLSREVNEDFSTSGLAHILSVSGLHIAVVAAGVYRLLRWLLSRSEWLLLRAKVRGVAALGALPATWAYVFVSGSEVPAVRSGLMASALFLAIALERDSDTFSSLAGALLAVLVWDPAALRSVSFQLSFTAVAGLVLLSEPLRDLVPLARPDLTREDWRGWLGRAREAVLGAALASLAASIATGPLVASAFHRASLVTVASNAVALPVASGLTALAAAAAALLPLGEAPTALLLCLADPLARALLYLSRVFAAVPFASPLVAAPSALFSLAWYAALAALLLRRDRPRRALRLGVGALAVLLGCTAARLAAPLLRSGATVTFLSVGQGDATLLQLPGGDVLVDAGGSLHGSFDPGERIVVPALLELGATRLRAIVLSHPHPDHANGLVAVLDRLGAEELWVPPGIDPQDPIAAPVLEAAQGRSVPVRELAAGDRVAIGTAEIQVLHPPRDGGWRENDQSLVLQVRFGQTSFLLPGDLEADAEETLLGAGLHATVLKVPHHGSRTSSSQAFLEAVGPAHAVFSVGKGNRFGFPHPEVLERYRRAGVQLHRTDTSGAWTFHSDGVRVQAMPYIPEPESPARAP